MKKNTRFNRSILLLALLPALLFAGGMLAFWRENALFTRSSGNLGDSAETSFNLYSPDQNQIPDAVAVLLHGRRCSSAMMASLAQMLARNGVKTYAVDLVGHGKSNFTLPLSCPPGAAPNYLCRLEEVYSALGSEILRQIHSREGPGLKKMILLGHSWGGRLGHDLVKRWPLEGVEPYLINLDGELRSPGYSGPNLFTVMVGPQSVGKSEITLPKTHISLIQDSEVNSHLLAWLGSKFSLSGDKKPSAHFGLVLFLAACLALFTYWLLGPISRIWAPEKSLGLAAKPAIAFVSLVGAVGAVAALAVLFLPLNHFFQWQMAFQNIYLFYLGVGGWIFWAAWIAFGGREQKNRSPWPALTIAAIAFLAQFLLIFWFTNHYIYHLGFSLLKLQKFLLYVVLLFPLCLGLHRLPWALRLLAWPILLGISLVSPKGMEVAETFSLLFVVGFMELYAQRLAALTKSNLAGGILLCLQLSWWAAAAYPTTTIFVPSREIHKFPFGEEGKSR